jgi:hypothetical protein
MHDTAWVNGESPALVPCACSASHPTSIASTAYAAPTPNASTCKSGLGADWGRHKVPKAVLCALQARPEAQLVVVGPIGDDYGQRAKEILGLGESCVHCSLRCKVGMGGVHAIQMWGRRPGSVMRSTWPPAVYPHRAAVYLARHSAQQLPTSAVTYRHVRSAINSPAQAPCSGQGVPGPCAEQGRGIHARAGQGRALPGSG